MPKPAPPAKAAAAKPAAAAGVGKENAKPTGSGAAQAPPRKGEKDAPSAEKKESLAERLKREGAAKKDAEGETARAERPKGAPKQHGDKAKAAQNATAVEKDKEKEKDEAAAEEEDAKAAKEAAAAEERAAAAKKAAEEERAAAEKAKAAEKAAAAAAAVVSKESGGALSGSGPAGDQVDAEGSEVSVEAVKLDLGEFGDLLVLSSVDAHASPFCALRVRHEWLRVGATAGALMRISHRHHEPPSGGGATILTAAAAEMVEEESEEETFHTPHTSPRFQISPS